MCNFAELTSAATSILRVFEEFISQFLAKSQKKVPRKFMTAKINPFKVYVILRPL